MRNKAFLTITALAMLAMTIPCFAQETSDVATAGADVEAASSDMTEGDAMTPADMAELEAAMGAGAGILAGAMMLPLIIAGAMTLLMLICWIRIFSKAGLPGIGAIVPIWNVILFCKAAGKPGWWFLLLLIPGVNVIISIIVTISLAGQFGKGVGYGLGLIFLPVIFYPMLAFGGAQYGGMELPDADSSDSGPGARPTRAAAPPHPGQTVQVQGGSFTWAAWLAIIATICFLALLLLQYLEFDYYGSHDPAKGMGSVWPAKVLE